MLQNGCSKILSTVVRGNAVGMACLVHGLVYFRVYRCGELVCNYSLCRLQDYDLQTIAELTAEQLDEYCLEEMSIEALLSPTENLKSYYKLAIRDS